MKQPDEQTQGSATKSPQPWRLLRWIAAVAIASAAMALAVWSYVVLVTVD